MFSSVVFDHYGVLSGVIWFWSQSHVVIAGDVPEFSSLAEISISVLDTVTVFYVVMETGCKLDIPGIRSQCCVIADHTANSFGKPEVITFGK